MSFLWELFSTFFRIGAFTFGGGYAMIAILDHICVEQKGWLTAEELMDITVIAESTPGPIAINCATYTGYRTAGMKGAVAATLGIILPSFLILLAISFFFSNLLAWQPVANAFRGIRVAVALIIIQTGVKMLRKLLGKTPDKKTALAFAGGAFVLVMSANLLGYRLSTIWLILLSGVLGWCLFWRKGGGK